MTDTETTISDYTDAGNTELGNDEDVTMADEDSVAVLDDDAEEEEEDEEDDIDDEEDEEDDIDDDGLDIDDDNTEVDDDMETDDVEDVTHAKTSLLNKHSVVFDIPTSFDNTLIIRGASRVTRPFITKYELPRIIGTRATQIKEGSKPMIVNSDGVDSYYAIAIMEIEYKVCPIYIYRPTSIGYEQWSVNELSLTSDVKSLYKYYE